MCLIDYTKRKVIMYDDELANLVGEWLDNATDEELLEVLEKAKANTTDEDRAFWDEGEIIPWTCEDCDARDFCPRAKKEDDA